MLKTTGVFTIAKYLLITVSAFAASRTLTGTVTDTMCGKKHMIAEKSDADCTHECMKSAGKWTYGLVAGEKVYNLAGDSKQFDAFAGQRVEVTGELNANTITVQRVRFVQ